MDFWAGFFWVFFFGISIFDESYLGAIGTYWKIPISDNYEKRKKHKKNVSIWQGLGTQRLMSASRYL